METSGVRPKPPLVVIVGPTASGKTDLAIRLALACGGEIICADSRTVYRGMDIGTAKPDSRQRALVPHWGLDLCDPGERFTVADFQRYATAKIADIRSRGKVPFVVGGTGLYVDALLFNYQLGAKSDDSLRSDLEGKSIQELQDYCRIHNIEMPENNQNKRYLIRAIEQNGINHRRKETPISNSIIVGISTDLITLRKRINLRAEELFKNGVVEEAMLLGKQYGWDSEAMTGNIYRLVRRYLDGEVEEQQLIEKFRILDWRLAKRQIAYMKRNKFINWLTLDVAEGYIRGRLADEQYL